MKKRKLADDIIEAILSDTTYTVHLGGKPVAIVLPWAQYQQMWSKLAPPEEQVSDEHSKSAD